MVNFSAVDHFVVYAIPGDEKGELRGFTIRFHRVVADAGQQVVSRMMSFECLFLQQQLESDAGVAGGTGVEEGEAMVVFVFADCRRLPLLIDCQVGAPSSWPFTSLPEVLLTVFILHWGNEWALVEARHLVPRCGLGELRSLLLPMLSASVLRSRMLVIAG